MHSKNTVSRDLDILKLYICHDNLQADIFQVIEFKLYDSIIEVNTDLFLNIYLILRP